ncbi:MAG TPA: RluA family pseudouridine synthase [Candidatus Borkfalkia excrementipullorum]|nr:RluA family pseudouridine synthase [Candidatus Borkfalkia excrementipullorum]
MDELNILHEDNHIIVVLKPQGVPTCGDESGDDSLLEQVRRYIKETYNKPGNVYVGLIHRLDRPTGGVMVFAKTSKAASRLAEQMRSGDFEKRYLAVLAGVPKEPQAKLVNYLKKNAVNNMVYVCPPTTDGAKMASLEYFVKEEKGGCALVEVKLHTGRTHQIRVQMANIGAPVYGDMRYGGENAKKGNLALWAYSLTFTHPVTKERLRFMAGPPEDGSPWKHFDLSKIYDL